jgi:hypothetical protein
LPDGDFLPRNLSRAPYKKHQAALGALTRSSAVHPLKLIVGKKIKKADTKKLGVSLGKYGNIIPIIYVIVGS